MIQTSYDPEADVLNVKFGAPGARSDGSREVAPGVFLEVDIEGQPIGLEIISVQRRARRQKARPQAA